MKAEMLKPWPAAGKPKSPVKAIEPSTDSTTGIVRSAPQGISSSRSRGLGLCARLAREASPSLKQNSSVIAKRMSVPARFVTRTVRPAILRASVRMVRASAA